MRALLIIFLLSVSSAKASTFNGTFWSKKLECSQLSPECLPSAIERPTLFDFSYPNDGNPTEISIQGKKYLAEIFIVKKQSEIDYYVIQTTLKTAVEQTLQVLMVTL